MCSPISPATRAAVLEAADALHFEPSHLARSLRTRTTSTIGFVVPDVSSPFYASALQGAQRVLEQAGYEVIAPNLPGSQPDASLPSWAGRILELLPGVPLVHTEERVALRKEVQGYITSPFGPESFAA